MKKNTVNIQVAQREQVWGLIVQLCNLKDTVKERDCDRLTIIQNMGYRRIRLHSSNIISLSVVTHTDKLMNIPPLHINCTQISITQSIADPASRCSSELWFCFLLLPAAQQGWSVSPCTLDASTLGRQQICYRWRRKASCHFLTTDTSHRLILHIVAIVGPLFKCCILSFVWFTEVCILYADVSDCSVPFS